ncbi:hypothetical protein LSCM1_01212 [Leishmania martiniquensis]|uniref:BART domain-containing protein n=1 Tax=Leishmania martiniquensis TaxID=1580590 RepID=A0A836KC95_9TRYP|nr:hypothetical protein LSCM1_01212 [Leishmania martiniquensis]
MSAEPEVPVPLASAVTPPTESPASPPAVKANTLLDELDVFFSRGENTDRLRRFIEENDDTFALVAVENEMNTDTKGSLRLYQLFQKYVALVNGIIEDFLAFMDRQDESFLHTLTSAIQEEWKSPSTAYRYLCTSYIAASMDYKDFLDFADDMYSMTHYSMLMGESNDGEEDSSEEIADGVSGGGYGFDDMNLS